MTMTTTTTMTTSATMMESMTMTELPERIWACMGGPMVGMFVSGGNNGGWPEYVRADRIEALTAERERLALAICGGEDAPGYANAQTVETLEHVAKQNRQSHWATINSLLAEEAERDEALNQLDSARYSVDVLEKRVAEFMAERDRLRGALTFYADPETYQDTFVAEDCECCHRREHPAIEDDNGKVARAALKGETP